MHYKVKSVAALHILLGGCPDRMRVEADADVGLSAKTVGELRKVTVLPENLAITTPPVPRPEEIIRVTRVSISSRYAPKP
jgi:hypothetical protein